MNRQYRHTQIGYLIILTLGPALLVTIALIVSSGYDWVTVSVFFFLAICLVLFATLTVTIDMPQLIIQFGPGVIRKSISLRDVQSVRPVTNSPLYGWGIRIIPSGWLYNVSGIRGVELEMKNGRKCRIGSDEPDRLAQAIQQSLLAIRDST